VIRKALLVGASAIMVLALAACGGPHSGVVHDKRYTPAHTSTETYCSHYDSKHNCTFHSTRHHHYSASYSLDIYSGKDHGWVSVDRFVYKKAHIGKRIDVDRAK
jgi:hypothetical protein